MAEFGVSIDGFTPAGDIVAQARAAEAGNADTLWIATHLYLRDPVALAGAALAATRTLKVALMAVSPYAMHPIHAAMAAATLDELHPGRVVLSLGVGAPADLAAAGIAAPRPLATLDESIIICRALFAGEAVEYAGERFHLSGRRLVNAPRQVPIALAASGPRMLDLAGRAADGVIISGATSVPFVRWCLDHAEAGAEARALKRYGIVYTRIAAHGGDARDSVRRTLGFILRGAHHARNVALAGHALDQTALLAAYGAEDWAEVDRLVNDTVVDAHAACGTAAEARARLTDYVAAGLDQIVLAGLTEPADIAATLDALT